MDPHQARRFVGPNMGPNCLLRLSVDDTGRQRVNFIYVYRQADGRRKEYVSGEKIIFQLHYPSREQSFTTCLCTIIQLLTIEAVDMIVNNCFII